MQRGRYASRYSEFDNAILSAHVPGTIGSRTPLTDLALANFGQAQVCCWTRPKDRRWGTHGLEKEEAAVMHFGMGVQGPEDCKVRAFELDLMLSSVGGQLGSSDDTPMDLEGEQNQVCLIELPAPSMFEGASPATHNAPRETCRSWRFCSNPIADQNSGQHSIARWLWEAYDEVHQVQGRVLYGGIALQHLGCPFLVSCHVKGKISKPNGIRLKFSNDHHQPRPWRLVPTPSTLDLQDQIDQLQQEIYRLNMAANQSK